MNIAPLAAPIILLLAVMPGWAADHYVRAGATGNASGSDWSNAYTALPATLQRGTTYYVASGSYPAHTFNDPESGTSLITIKKASAQDHGTDVGWQAGYGTGQAVFAYNLLFNSGYYVLDGSYGTGRVAGSYGV